MDSDSDDDDILTAVPLLMTEEASVFPRQIVIYEADSACDKPYGKIQKHFHGKIHSASSKVQAHSGDKIQGNLLNDSVEDFSIDIEDTFFCKMQDSSYNIKTKFNSKKSRSKKSKPKKGKKNRIQNKHEMAISENCNNDALEKSNGDLLQNLTGQSVSDNSRVEIEDSFLNTSQSIFEVNPDNISPMSQDVNSTIHENDGGEIQETVAQKNLGDKTQDNFVSDSVEDNSAIKLNFDPCVIQNPSTSKAETSFTNACKAKLGDGTILSGTQNDLNEVHKRNFDGLKNSHDEIEVVPHSKKQAISNELKRDSKKFKKSKKSRKNRVQNKFNVKVQNIAETIQRSCDKVEENYDENINENLDKLISSKVVDNANEDIADRVVDIVEDISVEVAKLCDDKAQDTFVSDHDTCDDEIIENYSEAQANLNQKAQENFFDVRQDSTDKIQNICDSVETVFSSNDLLIKETDKCHDMPGNKSQSITLKSAENFSSKFEDNSKTREDFVDSTYFFSGQAQSDSFNENQSNFVHKCKNLTGKDNKFENKTQTVSGFQENNNDIALENFTNFWDIYTKIQEDDEMHGISDEEINRILNEESQYVSPNELNENSDPEVQGQDDEIIDNSEDEIDELSDDERYESFRGRIIECLYGETKAKPYNLAFHFSSEEESDNEWDNEMVPNIQNCLILPSVKRCASQRNDLTTLARNSCTVLEELKQHASQVSKHHTSCVPYAEYELAEYFNFDPGCFYACQSLHYPSSYALAIAEFYANQEQYLSELEFEEYPAYLECCKVFTQKYKKRIAGQEPPSPSSDEPSLIANSADLLENIIMQCTVLPTKTGK